MKFLLLTILLAGLTILPLTAVAAVDTGKIVPCDGVEERCTFDHLLELAGNLIDYIVTYLAAPVAAIMFVTAGIYYMFDGGKGDKVTTAKKIFVSTLQGLVLVLASYLIIKAIIIGLLGDTSSESGRSLINFFKNKN